jgi:hypothetical protein
MEPINLKVVVGETLSQTSAVIAPTVDRKTGRNCDLARFVALSAVEKKATLRP